MVERAAPKRAHPGGVGRAPGKRPRVADEKRHARVECSLRTIPDLTDEQQRALDAVVRGENAFVTGSAGTGKSYWIDAVAATLPGATLTATTGVAAVAMRGRTLQSWAGLRVGEDISPSNIARNVRGNSWLCQRWRRATVVVVDEVSMLDAATFQALEGAARLIRSNNAPFGGIQVVFVGDFYQLPPVGASGYAFETAAWAACFPAGQCTHVFRRVWRQSDPAFVAFLAAVREGRITPDVLATLEALASKAPASDSDAIQPTRLHCTNASVDAHNDRELGKLDDDRRTFRAWGQGPKGEVAALERGCLAPTALTLCCGAQVMLLANIDQDAGLANGSRGVVVSFSDAGGRWPVVLFANGERRMLKPYEWKPVDSAAAWTQVPLKLAWAVTVHKSQGASIDLAEVHLRGAFAPGQIYVALSRCRTLEGMRVANMGALHPSSMVDARVKRFYTTLEILGSLETPEEG